MIPLTHGGVVGGRQIRKAIHWLHAIEWVTRLYDWLRENTAFSSGTVLAMFTVSWWTEAALPWIVTGRTWTPSSATISA